MAPPNIGRWWLVSVTLLCLLHVSTAIAHDYGGALGQSYYKPGPEVVHEEVAKRDVEDDDEEEDVLPPGMCPPITDVCFHTPNVCAKPSPTICHFFLVVREGWGCCL